MKVVSSLLDVEGDSRVFEYLIRCEREALEALRESIDQLLDGSRDHFHMFDQHWGGAEMLSNASRSGYRISHVRFDTYTDDGGRD